MWTDDYDFPSVEANHPDEWVLPELDEEWLEWWHNTTTASAVTYPRFVEGEAA